MDNKFDLDLALIPKELKILLQLIVTEADEQLNKEDFSQLDWNSFIELAIHHRIYPLLYSKLKNISTELIPNEVVQIISNKCKQNTFHMLFLSGEMEQINKLCNENRIPLLFLKGPVLAKELYGDLSLRTSSDLDVMIPIHKLGKMEELLQNSGYVKDEYIETVLSDWKWRHHHFTYIHPEKEVKVEVHWRLNPGPGKEPNFSELWERKSISILTKNELYFLGKEDLFLFLVSHGARHGWSRLRWLFDIDQIVKKDLNWIELHALLKKNHYLHLGGQALLLSSQLLNTEINEEMKFLTKGNRPKKLASEAIFYLERMVNLHTDPVPEEISEYHKRHLFTLMSNHQKIFYTISLLYPFPTDAKTLPLPKKLHFLYFPLRPVLCVWRKMNMKKHVLQ